MTRGARTGAVAMRGEEVSLEGDESKGSELGTGGGKMRVDRRRRVERRIKAVKGEIQEEKAIRRTQG